MNKIPFDAVSQTYCNSQLDDELESLLDLLLKLDEIDRSYIKGQMRTMLGDKKYRTKKNFLIRNGKIVPLHRQEHQR